MPDVFARLAREGVSVWLDDSGRARLHADTFAAQVRAGRVTGLITDPAPTALLRCLRSYATRPEGAAGAPPDPGVLRDVAAAVLGHWCDLLAPVHRDSGGRDGYVSTALGPGTTRDATGVLNAARELRKQVGRPNLMVQVPVTDATLAAIVACLESGIPVQATGVFGPRRHEQVLTAACTGLERARSAGRALAGAALLVSYSPGAVDTAVDGCLEYAGGAEASALLGRAGLGQARLTQECHERLLAGDRMQRLLGAGAPPPRLLWEATVPGTVPGRGSRPWRGASVGPCHCDTRYIEELVTPDTVAAVPESLLKPVAEHAFVSGDRVHGHYDDARRWIGRLAWFGVDLDAVTARLEQERAHRAIRPAWMPSAVPAASPHVEAQEDAVRAAAGLAA
ncbi:transaldolase family protein [Streptomyces puniciscabiei]